MLWPLNRCVGWAARASMRRSAGAWAGLFALLLQACASLPGEISRTASFALTDTSDTPLARIASASTPEAARGLSGFRLLPTGDYSLDARIALARRAVRSIDAQYYQVHSDAVGHRFLRELRDAAARGVRVRLLVDDFYTTGHDEMFAGFAAYPNVELRLFNPLPSRAGSTTRRVLASLHEFNRINHRMHNKLFVADNAISVTGGRNIGDEYFMSGAAANFIDLDVVAAGPIVGRLSEAFDSYWNSEHSYPIASIVARRDDASTARTRFDQLVRKHVAEEWPVQDQDMFKRPSVGRQLEQGRLELHPATARVLVDPPDKVRRTRGQSGAGTAFLDAINLMRSARAEVVMASPYFIPGERGVELMREAIGHGVRMSVLTNAADATDEPLVHFAYAKYRHDMLRAGVQIYELGGHLVTQSNELGIFGSSSGRLHAKVAVIDRRHVIVGSMNLDPRSARANTEVSLSIESPALAGEILGLVERSGHLAGSYKLRLAADGDHIEWVSRNGERELVTRDEPGATPLSRLWLWLLSHVIGEELL
jgi:putative cardiolipin synthase